MPEGSCRVQVGSICCTVLSDGYVTYPTSWFFPNADPDRLYQAFESRRQPHETILSPYTCLLIETGRHVVLVDTGAGESSGTTGAILARLEVAGIRARHVDTVVLTHAHPDHVGGAVNAGGRPTFPNARYVISEIEWDFWTSARPNLAALRLPAETKGSMGAVARRSLAALRLQAEVVGGEIEIVPGVRAIPAPGHTPGHMAVVVSSDGRQLLNAGDAAVHPLHLEEPEWENGLDQDPALALATRRSLAERAVAGNMHWMAFHFPFPSVGSIQARPEGGWKWTPGW